MGTKLRALTVALTLGFALVAAGSSAADVPVPEIQDNALAFAPIPSLPTADPCVFNELLADAHGNWTGPFNPGTLLQFFFFRVDLCTDQTLVRIAPPPGGPNSFISIDASDFIVSPRHDSADLNVTLPAEDSSLGAPATVSLHWASTRAQSDGSATVTGTISSGSFSFVLDNSIVWHPFGSASFPQAGLWHCVNSPINEKPGCIHQ
jgi:hypothetical protein